MVKNLDFQVKTYNYESKRASDVKHNQSKSNIYVLLLFKIIVIMASYSFFLHMNFKELKIKIHLKQFSVLILIYIVWKCTPIVLNGVNFAKDYQKDS